MLGVVLERAAPQGWWPEGASLAVDFGTGRCMRDGAWVAPEAAFSFARASAGWADDRAGQWTSFGSGMPRLTDRGLLIEAAAQNVMRNSAMAGAVVGTPGTPPTHWSRFRTGALNELAIVAKGSERGIDYVDVRVSGTASGSNDVGANLESTIAIAASAHYTASMFAKVISGSLASLTYAQFSCGRYNSGAYVSGSPAVDLKTLTGTLVRRSFADTVPASGVNQVRPSIAFRVPNGVAVDAVVRVGWTQLEVGGAGATSPVVTSGAAASRAADVLTFDLPSGTHDLTVVFDDESVQVIEGVSGSYVMPVDLDRARMAQVFAVPQD